MRILDRSSVLHPRNYRIYLALFLGAAFGLSVYSYWLVQVVPPLSKRIALYTALAVLVGMVGYFVLLEFWIVPRLSRLSRREWWGIIVSGILTGVFLTFAGTNIWKSSAGYVAFLLPSENLNVSVSGGPDAADVETAILWFTTSAGDVSYDSLGYQGWKRKGDELVLSDANRNALTWSGRTGEQAMIVFLKSPQGGQARISWNGESETVDLSAEGGGKYQYAHRFHVPFYASRSLTFLLVVLNFVVVSCALVLAIWSERRTILAYFEEAFSNKASKPLVESGTGWRLEWGIVVAVMILAMLLRVFNLENLYPYTDEYNHLLAARALLSGAALNTVYQRSLFLVTLPVAFFFRIFGVHLWAARLAGVLFNAFAVIPLYFLGRKLNKPIAIISSLLYATNPWIIAISRNVREYAYYPLYFYAITFGMAEFLSLFPNRFVLLRDWRTVARPRAGLLAVALILPIVYSILDQIFVHPSSTFKIMLVAYCVFGMFLLGKFDARSRSNAISLAVVGMGAIAGGYFFLIANPGNISIIPDFNGYAIRYFFSDPQQQWYFGRSAVLPSLALLVAVSLGLTCFRINPRVLFFSLLYFAYMFFFTFFFNRYIRPRYIISAEFWYVTLMGIGFYGIWSVLRLLFLKKNLAVFLGAALLLILTFNVSQILLPVRYREQGYMPITEEYHDDVAPAHLFLLGKVKDGDVLISTIYGQYVKWVGSPAFEASYYFDYTDSGSRAHIFSIVEKADSGWIVVDARRYNSAQPLPRRTISAGHKRIEYMGQFSDQYIWRWSN